MTWSLTKIILLLSLLLFTGLFWWLPEALVEPAIKITGLNRKEPDYWIKNFSVTSMNDAGNPKYRLQAANLVHYPNDISTRIDKPYLVQYDQGPAPLITTADTGIVSPDGKRVVMTGNVRIARGQDAEFSDAEVMSHQVTVTLE